MVMATWVPRGNIKGPPGESGVPGSPGEVTQAELEDAIEIHVQAPEPHPAYDDLPSLVLLFENRLV